MLTKAQVSYIKTLWQHKVRKKENAFIAEGAKIAEEFLKSNFSVTTIIATSNWAESNLKLIAHKPQAELFIVKESVLESMSSLKTANQVLIVVHIPEYNLDDTVFENKWTLALDNIQDPGNMGTIIRVADWFGIETIVCSEECADAYNQKVVQAAMGSHIRVKAFYTDLHSFLQKQNLPKFAATLNGNNIFNTTIPNAGFLVIGNESAGITENVLSVCTNNITIPRIGGAESLNAGVSAGILCAVLSKNLYVK